MPQPHPVTAVNLPLFHYTITLLDGKTLEADAIEYQDVESWMVFEDTHGSVLTILRPLVAHVARSAEPVGSREVEKS